MCQNVTKPLECYNCYAEGVDAIRDPCYLQSDVGSVQSYKNDKTLRRICAPTETTCIVSILN